MAARCEKLKDLLTSKEVVAAVVGVILGLVGGEIVRYINEPGQPATSPQPSVNIRSVDWEGSTSKYSVNGSVADLGNNLVWSFNQRTDGGVGPTYIEMGPCRTEQNGTYKCNSNYAGVEEQDRGREFTIWVAVVTPQQAADMAVLKAIGQHAFPTPNLIPHVPGEVKNNVESTLVSFRTTHP